MSDGRNPALKYSVEDEIRWLLEDSARVMAERLTPGAVDWRSFDKQEPQNWAHGERLEGEAQGGPVPGSYSEGAINLVKDFYEKTGSSRPQQDFSEYLQKIYGYAPPQGTPGAPIPGVTFMDTVGDTRVYKAPSTYSYGGGYYPRANAIVLQENAQGGFEPSTLGHEYGGHKIVRDTFPVDYMDEYRMLYQSNDPLQQPELYKRNRDEQFARVASKEYSGVADVELAKAAADKAAGTYAKTAYRAKMENPTPEQMTLYRKQVYDGLKDWFLNTFANQWSATGETVWR